MRTILTILAAALFLTGAPQARADGPVVVELFTSQGCSSCPPADALLAELAGRDDIIALALHVDYWDYIGWADTFASPQFTARQHGYGRAAGSTVIYTPQFIIGGVDHVVGSRPMAVADLIAAHRAQEYPVDVSATRQGGEVLIRVEPRALNGRVAMVVQLVQFTPLDRVEITRGENAGRQADYHNIVTTWQIMDEWDGQRPYQQRVRPESADPLAVIVQAAGNGPIMGAARLD